MATRSIRCGPVVRVMSARSLDFCFASVATDGVLLRDLESNLVCAENAAKSEHYSITSSALASKVGGTMIPMSRAALVLIENLKEVG